MPLPMLPNQTSRQTINPHNNPLKPALNKPQIKLHKQLNPPVQHPSLIPLIIKKPKTAPNLPLTKTNNPRNQNLRLKGLLKSP